MTAPDIVKSEASPVPAGERLRPSSTASSTDEKTLSQQLPFAVRDETFEPRALLADPGRDDDNDQGRQRSVRPRIRDYETGVAMRWKNLDSADIAEFTLQGRSCEDLQRRLIQAMRRRLDQVTSGNSYRCAKADPTR
ncbi:MAG: hypothetical protein H6676_10875 [Thermoflexaceae bacterium]|nr:hypothetical protein [Thermoflexaceae bacterium]